MSDENIRPWYQDPRIIFPALVAILAAVVGATWAIWLNRSPSDFILSVSPMQGSVLQSGEIQTTISVKGLHGYEHPVSLSATGHPADALITFLPQFGEATPAYASTMTLTVGLKVPPGDHTVTIKGTGADGKEHSCNYNFTVIPPPPQPPVEPFVVFSDIGIASGDVWVWSGADWGLEGPRLVDGNYVTPDAPEGTKCYAVIGGTSQRNYVGWGVFLGTFENHELIAAHTIDLSNYDSLQFWVKTTVDLKVEIQQDNNMGKKSFPCLLSNYGWGSSSSQVWQKVTIPKTAFRNVDLTEIFGPFMITGSGSEITFYIDGIKWIP